MAESVDRVGDVKGKEVAEWTSNPEDVWESSLAEEDTLNLMGSLSRN